MCSYCLRGLGQKILHHFDTPVGGGYGGARPTLRLQHDDAEYLPGTLTHLDVVATAALILSGSDFFFKYHGTRLHTLT
jgi:hypothetical protein